MPRSIWGLRQDSFTRVGHPAQAFGHLPAIFLTSGAQWTSGVSQTMTKRSSARSLAAGKPPAKRAYGPRRWRPITGRALVPFYGTGQPPTRLLMEFMGLHLPGASFVNPNTPLRDALTVVGTHGLWLSAHLWQ